MRGDYPQVALNDHVRSIDNQTGRTAYFYTNKAYGGSTLAVTPGQHATLPSQFTLTLSSMSANGNL